MLLLVLRILDFVQAGTRSLNFNMFNLHHSESVISMIG